MEKRESFFDVVPLRLTMFITILWVVALGAALIASAYDSIVWLLLWAAASGLGCGVICVIVVLFSAYRRFAYRYMTETLWAEVVEKYHSTYYEGYMLFVRIKTENGLLDTITDADLYDWAEVGKRFKVTMKVGRTRGRKPEPKYWKVVDYSLH